MNLPSSSLVLLLGSLVTAQSPCSLVTDTYPGATGSRLRNFKQAFGGSLLFCAQTPTHWGLFRSWGGAGLQLLIKDPRADHSLVTCNTPQGARAFFVARDPKYGVELHITDGTPQGTRMVKDIRPGGLGCAFDAFVPFGDRILFSCYDYQLGSEPFISDGTAAGTFRLKDVNPGRSHSAPRSFVAAGKYAVFVANDPVHGLELWGTDGTQTGTRLLKDINSPLAGYPKNLTRLGNSVLFSAYTNNAGRELWISDGTSIGTRLLKDIFVGTADSHPGPFVVMGDKAYFGATNGTHGHELWETDGTPGGTKMVKDLTLGTLSSNPTRLTLCDGKLYFSGRGKLSTPVPYVSDGTAAGTYSLVANYQLKYPHTPKDFTAAAGWVFFSANNELWVTDGTAAGTRLPRPLTAGGPSHPLELTAAGAGICFRADDSSSGTEVWFSDGSTQRTARICDLNPGSADSSPKNLTLAGGRLFFSATTPSTGTELHSIARPGATTVAIQGASEPHRPALAIAGGHSPILGGNLRLEARGPVGHTGFLVLGLPTDLPQPAIPSLLSRGADWVAALGPSSIILASGAAPLLSIPVVVPNAAGLDGSRANLQAWWIGPGPLQFQVSNGVQLRLGTGAPR